MSVDFGAIEGRLEATKDSRNSIKIMVKDQLYPRAINCVVPERMIELVLANFGKRVEIEGRIHYRRDGFPESIEVEQISHLPDDSELPTASDVRGILA